MTVEKKARYLKIVAMIALATLGWIVFSLGVETSAYFKGFAAGALAVILFQLSIFYFVLSVVMSIDLFGSRVKNPILSGKKLLVAMIFAGFFSALPFAALFVGPSSPLLFVYLIIVSFSPLVVWAMFEKEAGRLKIKLN